MRNAVWVDVIGVGAIIGWIALSVVFARDMNGDMFQRMGAAGVAVAVAYFAFVRHSLTNPVGLNERLYWISRTLDLYGRSLNIAFSNSTVIASVWKQKCEEKGQEVPQPISELASTLEHASYVQEQAKKFTEEDADKIHREDMDRSNSADELVSSTSFRSDLIQMGVIVLATIQWGFGDLWFPAVCEVSC